MPVFRLRNRRRPGQVLAEMPVMLICLIFGFTIPLIVFATLGYRAILLWVSTRAACQAAAKCTTFSNAQSIATATLNSQVNKNGNIAINTQTLYIVTQSINIANTGPTFTTSTTPLATGSVDITANTYFLRYSVNGTIQPLFPDTAYLGTNPGGVPGLTKGITLSIASENYFESPNGLTQ
jgi:hypothetical protein